MWVSSALWWWQACLCARHRERSQPAAQGRGCSLLLAWYPGGLSGCTQLRLRPQNKDTEQMEKDLWRATKMTREDAKNAPWQGVGGAGFLKLLRKRLRRAAAIFLRLSEGELKRKQMKTTENKSGVWFISKRTGTPFLCFLKFWNYKQRQTFSSYVIKDCLLYTLKIY